MTVVPKGRWRSPVRVPPPCVIGAPTAHPGRTVFLPRRRTGRGSPERRGPGEIAGPLRAPPMSAAREVV